MKNIPKVSKIAERKVLLSGVGSVNALIKKLNVKREIGLAKLEGSVIHARDSRKKPRSGRSIRKIVTACYSKVPRLAPFIAKIFEDLINEQQYQAPP